VATKGKKKEGGGEERKRPVPRENSETKIVRIVAATRATSSTNESGEGKKREGRVVLPDDIHPKVLGKSRVASAPRFGKKRIGGREGGRKRQRSKDSSISSSAKWFPEGAKRINRKPAKQMPA